MKESHTIDDGWAFCDEVLPAVSRSFALIIPQCPEPIDRALCVAYLICRLADTVEDEPALSGACRSDLYDALLDAVDEPADAARAEVFISAWPVLPEGDYGRLVEGTKQVMAAYASLGESLRQPVNRCVHEMIAGMRQTAPAEVHSGIAFVCRDMADFELYCHYVAGTVGIMSTALFETRLDPAAFVPTDEWREEGRRLGLGLQMTNIIKDCQTDADRGVSFIPADCVDLRQSSYELLPAGRAMLIDRCIGHLDAGLRYTLAMPDGETGIRTFLLGSLLPAIATLEVAAPGNDPAPKIDREKMAEIFHCIERHLADNHALRVWYSQHRKRTLAALAR